MRTFFSTILGGAGILAGGNKPQIGNAAIEGACIALLSVDKRNELEEMVKYITHCRLETHPDFFDYFVEGCQFNPVESLDKEKAE